MESRQIGKIALLWRGDPNAPQQPTAENNRLHRLFQAFADRNVAAEAVVYSDEIAGAVRDRLLQVNGVMVWVDPITQGQDRSKLDPMLREVSARGVWVSAHPDVILKMGTKEVLFQTRSLGWGADTDLYSTVEDFKHRFPEQLAATGPRVLKQRRGNGGIGTWKVELSGADATIARDNAAVRVKEARAGGAQEVLPLSEFMARCESYFSGGGCIIDQAFQPRVGDGMIRCYLVHDKVAGFSTQSPRADPTGGSAGGPFAMAREKTMYQESAPRFQVLRTRLESQWVPAMQRMLSIDTGSLPVLWDADFLYGPKNARGEDGYVLCEINVSAVFPFPEHASERIAEAAIARM
jgi:Domain of unknown function (DUF6815)